MKLLLSILICIFLSACSLYPTVDDELRKVNLGMKMNDLIELMGGPENTQAQNNSYILKYYIKKSWNSRYPYYFIFDSKNKELVKYYIDQKEYAKEQQGWSNFSDDFFKAMVDVSRQKPSNNVYAPVERGTSCYSTTNEYGTTTNCNGY